MNKVSQRKFLVILNPISGKGKARRIRPIIEAQLKDKTTEVFFEESQGPQHASKITSDAINHGFDAIVAVGGDGTVNEIGRELVGTKIPLGIIPLGSGNGLARHLKIPMNHNKSIQNLKDMNVIAIDTGLLDNHRFLNIAGIGFDAQVAKVFSKSKHRGWFNYARIILQQFSNISVLDLSLFANEELKNIQATMVSFANSSQFGNNARIAPYADIQDGLIDICILGKTNFWNTLNFTIRTMTGRLKKTSYYQTFQSDYIKINGTNNLGQIDGEPIEINTELEVKIEPASLNIIVPK